MRRTFAIAALLAVSLFVPMLLFAYPDSEILGAGGTNPPFDFGITSTQSGQLMISDRRLALSFGELLRLVDTGFFALESSQPPAPSSEEDTEGIIAGIAYLSTTNDIVASQQDGDILLFDLDDITATPDSIVVSEGKSLGPLAADSDRQVVYVANNSDRAIHVVDLLARSVTSTIPLTIVGVSSFSVTDALFVEDINEIYFTTDAGAVFYLSPGGPPQRG